jgi:hypothetical protein
MPAASITARTAPPAMTPVPEQRLQEHAARAEDAYDLVRDGRPRKGDAADVFLASSMPFNGLADLARLAQAEAHAPLPSPTTQSAANLKMRPPLTVLETRFKETTFSVNSWGSSSRFRLLSRLSLL